MKSALYSGWVRHRRFGTTENAFRYRLFMSYLDLAELPRLFDGRWFWSARHPALAWFRRKDFLGPTHLPLDTAVRDRVEAHTGERPRGPIRLLTHLRFFGYSFNPVTFYYVFDAADRRVETIVAEITNTPWKERHAYVLPVDRACRRIGRGWQFSFFKQLHVSPFLPMETRYSWNFVPPGRDLHVHMENWRNGEIEFDATLILKRREIGAATLAMALLRFPLMSVQVSALIYWQALKLWLRRAPFHINPSHSA